MYKMFNKMLILGIIYSICSAIFVVFLTYVVFSWVDDNFSNVKEKSNGTLCESICGKDYKIYNKDCCVKNE